MEVFWKHGGGGVEKNLALEAEASRSKSGSTDPRISESEPAWTGTVASLLLCTIRLLYMWVALVRSGQGLDSGLCLDL